MGKNALRDLKKKKCERKVYDAKSFDVCNPQWYRWRAQTAETE